jgi:hypothetical protein
MPRHTHSNRRLTKQLTDLSFAAPMVIATRVSRMLAAGASPNASDRRENQQMVAEKISASQDAMTAMAMSALRIQGEFASATMQTWLRPWSNPVANPAWWLQRATTVAEEGLAPISARAVGNARRLHGSSKRK